MTEGSGEVQWCPCCGYETHVFSDDAPLCPNGCTVDDFEERVDALVSPPFITVEVDSGEPTDEEEEVVAPMFGSQPETEQRLVLVETDSRRAELLGVDDAEGDDE